MVCSAVRRDFTDCFVSEFWCRACVFMKGEADTVIILGKSDIESGDDRSMLVRKPSQFAQSKIHRRRRYVAGVLSFSSVLVVQRKRGTETRDTQSVL